MLVMITNYIDDGADSLNMRRIISRLKRDTFMFMKYYWIYCCTSPTYWAHVVDEDIR